MDQEQFETVTPEEEVRILRKNLEEWQLVGDAIAETVARVNPADKCRDYCDSVRELGLKLEMARQALYGAKFLIRIYYEAEKTGMPVAHNNRVLAKRWTEMDGDVRRNQTPGDNMNSVMSGK